jgi:hypothetical protein
MKKSRHYLLSCGRQPCWGSLVREEDVMKVERAVRPRTHAGGRRRWRRRRLGTNGGIGWKTLTAARRETRDMAGDGGMEGRWRD